MNFDRIAVGHILVPLYIFDGRQRQRCTKRRVEIGLKCTNQRRAFVSQWLAACDERRVFGPYLNWPPRVCRIFLF